MENNIYESKEELYFSWWCHELKEKGIITRYLYESNSFVLSEAKKYKYLKKLITKVKEVEGHLLDEHSYKPDFIIEWNPEYDGLFYRNIDSIYTFKPPFTGIKSRKNESIYGLFEVKGNYDMNNMTRLFRINQKWMYDKYNLFVELVIIPDLFKKTFTPERYLMTDSGRQARKINFGIKIFDEYVQWLKNQQFSKIKEV